MSNTKYSLDEINSDEQLLKKIKNVDGSGSGLDADLLRGLPADFTASLSSNGYQKLPSGLIIQWMYGVNTTAGDITITYPISFPNAVVSVVGTQVLSSTSSDKSCTPFSVTTSQSSFARRNYDGSNSSEDIFVIALGY